MNHELINFNIHTSKFAILASGISFITLIILLNYATISVIYKLVVLLLFVLILILQYLNQLNHRVEACDILIQLNEIIIWQGKKAQLATITRLQNIGYIAIIISYKVNNAQQNLMLFYDSINISTYKRLLRHIKWQSTTANSN